jgi:hypothetical protein
MTHDAWIDAVLQATQRLVQHTYSYPNRGQTSGIYVGGIERPDLRAVRLEDWERLFYLLEYGTEPAAVGERQET